MNNADDLVAAHLSNPVSGEIATYQIRTYGDGDEKELVKLFNRVYMDYAGFVPRTPAFWLWFCKSRPGIREEGIIIAKLEGKVIAYAVVSDSGEILEFCYDPEYAGEDVVLRLLETVEDHVKDFGGSSVTLNAPKDDHVVRKACNRLEYAESSLPYAFQLSVLDFSGLIKEILLSRLKDVKVDLSGEILLKVKQSSPMGYDHITIRISDGDLQAEKEKSGKPNLVIEADKQTFASCIFRGMNLRTAILTKKIKVSPFWKALQALTFLSLLRVDDPWYVPLSDHG